MNCVGECVPPTGAQMMDQNLPNQGVWLASETPSIIIEQSKLEPNPYAINSNVASCYATYQLKQAPSYLTPANPSYTPRPELNQNSNCLSTENANAYGGLKMSPPSYSPEVSNEQPSSATTFRPNEMMNPGLHGYQCPTPMAYRPQVQDCNKFVPTFKASQDVVPINSVQSYVPYFYNSETGSFVPAFHSRCPDSNSATGGATTQASMERNSATGNTVQPTSSSFQFQERSQCQTMSNSLNDSVSKICSNQTYSCPDQKLTSIGIAVGGIVDKFWEEIQSMNRDSMRLSSVDNAAGSCSTENVNNSQPAIGGLAVDRSDANTAVDENAKTSIQNTVGDRKLNMLKGLKVELAKLRKKEARRVKKLKKRIEAERKKSSEEKEQADEVAVKNMETVRSDEAVGNERNAKKEMYSCQKNNSIPNQQLTSIGDVIRRIVDGFWGEMQSINHESLRFTSAPNVERSSLVENSSDTQQAVGEVAMTFEDANTAIDASTSAPILNTLTAKKEKMLEKRYMAKLAKLKKQEAKRMKNAEKRMEAERKKEAEGKEQAEKNGEAVMNNVTMMSVDIVVVGKEAVMNGKQDYVSKEVNAKNEDTAENEEIMEMEVLTNEENMENAFVGNGDVVEIETEVKSSEDL